MRRFRAFRGTLLLAAVLAAAAPSLPAGQGAADPRADGARAAKVAAALTGPFNISLSSTPSGDTLVGVDGSGVAYAVWFEYAPTRQFYFATNRGGSWSAPYSFDRIHYDAEEAGFPVLAVSSSGVCHLVFQDVRDASYDIFHAAYDGSWGAAVNLSANEGGSAYSGVGVNPVTHAASVVWQDGTGLTHGWDILGRVRSASGSWGARLSLPVGGGYMPKIAFDGTGTAHMVWGTGWGTTVWYARNRTPESASGWTSGTLIKYDVGEDWSYPKVAADNAGNAYMIWMDGTRGNDEIFLVRIAADGSVGSEVNVSQSAASSHEATLAVDKSSGSIYVAWVENGDIFFNMYNGSWLGPQNLTNGAGASGQPSLAVDASGVVHLVFRQLSGGNDEIFYASVTSGPLPPAIRVISPNGGETWAPGTAHDVTWTTRGATVSAVRIELSTNGGAGWSTLAASVSNTGSYAWTVPSSASPTCLVRVSDTGNSGLTDASDGYFAIGTPPPAAAKITVVAPNGGEVWEALTTQQILWTTQGTVGAVRIELTLDGGASWSDIVASTPNGGAYAWTVPNSPGPYCGVRISQASTGTPVDTSDAVFTISPPPRAAPPIGLTLGTRLAGGEATKINTLGWQDNPDNRAIQLLSYKIYRKPVDAADDQFALIATVSPLTHAYEDANLTLTRKFTYALTALGRTGPESEASEFVTEIPVFPPLDGAAATIVNSSLFKRETMNVVTWRDNPLNIPVSVVRYNIYRKATGQDDAQFKKVAWVLSSEFEYRDRKLAAGDAFEYRVTAVDAAGTESAPVAARFGN
jgi:hypothetical protein